MESVEIPSRAAPQILLLLEEEEEEEEVSLRRGSSGQRRWMELRLKWGCFQTRKP